MWKQDTAWESYNNPALWGGVLGLGWRAWWGEMWLDSKWISTMKPTVCAVSSGREYEE